jgi:hypothetical protein
MITIGFSTREDNQKYIDYLKKTSGLKDVEVIQKINNGDKSLSQVYNEILSESKYDIVVLCHDDIEFDTQPWGKRILKHFTNTDFGILGVAGTTDMPESGMWWEDKRKMIGIVNHKHEGKKWESKYSKSWGDDVTQSCLVDGLFIAINKTLISETFDESVNGFHFYDVQFCINNFLKDVKIGVIYNIRITHLSIGQTNNKWEENRLIFSEKYKDSLPIKSKINLNYNQSKEFKFLKKYNLRIIINSGKNIEWVKETISKINSFNLPNYQINLISNEEISEDIKNLNNDKIKIYDGFFDELSKNLSILKWEDNFIEKEDTLIFFIDKNVKILNNVFSSICKLHHTEKSNFGCAFTATLNDDMTILSTEFNLSINKNNQVNILLKDIGTYYNLLNGYKSNKMGNLSDVFVTTYNNLISNDWFDIQYETNLTFNDFALKCVSKNQKCFVDVDSITVQDSFSDGEKLNQDINKFVQTLNTNQKYQYLIRTIDG